VGRVDGCSGKFLTLAANGFLAALSYNPTFWWEVERAYDKFDVACRSHDYAYDLIRNAWRFEAWSYKIGGRGHLVRDREDADFEMREMVTLSDIMVVAAR
jgi:hypothetical protein